MAKSLREIVREELSAPIKAIEDRIEAFFESDSDVPNLERQDTRKARSTNAVDARIARAVKVNASTPRTNGAKASTRVGQRRANKVYEVIPRKRNAEPKRPGDRPVFQFLLRHKQGQTLLDVEKGTKREQKVVQNNLWRLGKEGLIRSREIE